MPEEDYNKLTATAVLAVAHVKKEGFPMTIRTIVFAVSLVVVCLPVLFTPAPAAAQVDRFKDCLGPRISLSTSDNEDEICLQLEVRYTIDGFATLVLSWTREYADALKEELSYVNSRDGKDLALAGFVVYHPDPDSGRQSYTTTGISSISVFPHCQRPFW